MPYADLPEPKYAVGQELWYADTIRETAKLPCPDCCDTKQWKVETPAGRTYEVPCQRCCGGHVTYTSQDLASLEYPVWKGVARRLTPKGIEVRSNAGEGWPRITYDGRPEDQLYDTEHAALQVACLRASEQNAKEQAKPDVIAAKNIATLKIDDAKYEQFASGLWNAWYAYRSLIDRVSEWAEEASGDERGYVEALRESLAWEVEYREKKDRPLDALVDAVRQALAGDLTGLPAAYAALPDALRRDPSQTAEAEAA